MTHWFLCGHQPYQFLVSSADRHGPNWWPLQIDQPWMYNGNNSSIFIPGRPWSSNMAHKKDCPIVCWYMRHVLTLILSGVWYTYQICKYIDLLIILYRPWMIYTWPCSIALFVKSRTYRPAYRFFVMGPARFTGHWGLDNGKLYHIHMPVSDDL